MTVKLFLAFAKVGALSFGGGMAIIALIFDSIQSFASITQSQFADIVAIAQVTPGPVAINTATYVGYVSAGLQGSFAATLGAALPAFIMTGITCRMVEKYKESNLIKGALRGIKPATVGMIATAMITLAEPAFVGEKKLAAGIAGIGDWLSSMPIDLVSVLICIATVVLIGKYKKNAIVVLLSMGCIGAVLGVY